MINDREDWTEMEHEKADIKKRMQYILNMRPVFNKEALFSDGTEYYRIPAEPKAGDTVTIKFRTQRNNVDSVYLVSQEQRVQMEIADLVAAKSSDSIHATAEDPAAGAFAVRYDYYEVMNGFAADVEYRFLKDIAALDSVDSVYVETVFTVPEDQEQDYENANALAMVGADSSPYTGDGQVIAIIDSGVDVEHEGRRLNFQNTLTRLLELGALPIINENDTVATDEITSIGDNDTLAAIVTCCIKADLLVLLSDIDGLYTANPHTHPDAKLIPLVERITPEVLALADGAGSALGTGGMSTKLRAAQMVTAEGADMVIANGSYPELLYDIADGRPAGTRFAGRKEG